MILQEIIEEDYSNTVIKVENSSLTALNEIPISDIDIVLVDLLMPSLDGVTLVKKIRKLRPKLKFIMISQVKNSSMRQDAYNAGIEFFINKPINIVEVRSVVNKVKESIEMEAKIKLIQDLLGPRLSQQTQESIQEKQLEKIQSILSFIGITSEAGYPDIISICQILLRNHIYFEQLDFAKHLALDSHTQKIMLQRVRRAIKKGMINMAHLCIDDFENEITIQYANALFGYQHIHSEIQVIQNQSYQGGKVSIRKFFDELIIQSHNTDSK